MKKIDFDAMSEDQFLCWCWGAASVVIAVALSVHGLIALVNKTGFNWWQLITLAICLFFRWLLKNEIKQEESKVVKNWENHNS